MVDADWALVDKGLVYMKPTPPGGVLASAEIRALVEEPEEGQRPLIENWEPEPHLRAARYDVRVELDEPAARVNGQASSDPALVARYLDSLIIYPGGSGWFSTRELFNMPRNIAGTVTLRSEFAARGLFLLSGTLIDPCYGTSRPRSGRPLHFFLANLGCEPIVLKPERDAVAAVQFLVVAGQVEDEKAQDPAGSLTANEATLGFIENLQGLQRGHRELESEFKRTRDLTRGLIVLGYFVLGTAVISAALATIFSITADTSLVADIRQAGPRSDSGRWMLAIMVASVALVTYTASVVLGPRRPEPRVTNEGRDPHVAVVDQLRARANAKVLTTLIVALALALMLGGLIADGDPDLHYWWAWLVPYTVLSIATIWTVQHFRASLTMQEVELRTSKLLVAAGDSDTLVGPPGGSDASGQGS